MCYAILHFCCALIHHRVVSQMEYVLTFFFTSNSKLELHSPDQVAYENLNNNRATETTNTDASTEYQVLDTHLQKLQK